MKKRVISIVLIGMMTAFIYHWSEKGILPMGVSVGAATTQEAGAERTGRDPEEIEKTEETGQDPKETAAPEETGQESEETVLEDPKETAALEETGQESEETEQDPKETATPEETGQEPEETASLEETGQELEETAPEPEETESEYANLAIAQVDHYVNVRQEPNTDSAVLGKIYDGAVAQILETAGEEQDWFHVVSGNVKGYIKAEYFLYGDAAVEAVDRYVTRYATVIADRLNVRQEQSTDSRRIGYIDHGEKVKILEQLGDWLLVQYTDNRSGYVAAEYVTVSEEFTYAKSIEEEQAQLAAQRELEARMAAEEENTPENITVTALAGPNTAYTSNEELRSSIIDYAMQYLGYPYVHGGKSLEGGTDCSGFTCYIYAAFGYSISRTPSGQYSSAGRSIDYSEIQPGDIICYGKSKCTHVAMYIGDGQVIHEANSRKGVVIYEADYDNILGIKNIID